MQFTNRNIEKDIAMTRRMRAPQILLILAAIGMLAATYGIYLHLAPAGSGVCNVNETFNCDKVNKSPWSEVLGIPVAALGLFAYAALFAAVLFRRPLGKLLGFTQKDVWGYVLGLSLIMLAFQLYLTSLEFFVIYAYCIICLVSQAVILAVTYFALQEYRSASV